uniref:Uncharacterized protein n=1 Tax=Candidatus Giovannonibacteria bacterium GW2011_GWF2_42_19 TaxID=1618659 RepID=A0A0G0ZDW9_9BACT|nr:MAG: hypothetical protein UV11_C0022G0003 [Candidatus Giovannonibacteria bacterium GW2011_GWF2_42_19]
MAGARDSWASADIFSSGDDYDLSFAEISSQNSDSDQACFNTLLVSSLSHAPLFS